MRGEHAAGDPGVRASGDFDGREVVVDSEALAEAAPERAFPGPAGSQQRAVDVEEEKFFFQGSEWQAGGGS
jgi:hypothetical protein